MTIALALAAARTSGHHLSMAQSNAVVAVVMAVAGVLFLLMLGRMAGIGPFKRKQASPSQYRY